MKTPRITPEEIGIIKRAQAGDESAFSQIFQKYRPFVSKILFSYIKDPDEADDITNVVFLKVYKKLSTFTEYESFGGWLRVLSNRVAIDYLREVKSNSRMIENFKNKGFSCNAIIGSEDEMVNRLTYKNILEEFEKLPEQTKQVCELFYIDNLTVSQIKEALNIPTGTIKSLLFRTRKKIQKQFKQEL